MNEKKSIERFEQIKKIAIDITKSMNKEHMSVRDQIEYSVDIIIFMLLQGHKMSKSSNPDLDSKELNNGIYDLFMTYFDDRFEEVLRSRE